MGGSSGGRANSPLSHGRTPSGALTHRSPPRHVRVRARGTSGVHRRARAGQVRQGRRPRRQRGRAHHPRPRPHEHRQRADEAARGVRADRRRLTRPDRAARPVHGTPRQPPHQGRIPVRRRVRARHVARRGRQPRLARAARGLQPRRRAPDHRRQPRPAARADPRAGRQLHRHRPPVRQRPRPPAAPQRVVVTPAGHAEHPGGPAVGGEGRAAVPEDDDREGPRHRRHARRLRQRFQAEHRLVTARDHGLGDPGSRRPVRDRDRGDRGPGVLHRRDRRADDPRHPGRRRRRRRPVGRRRQRVHRHQGPGPPDRGLQPGRARDPRTPVRPRQPAERPVHRVQRQPVRDRRDGRHLSGSTSSSPPGSGPPSA